MKMSKHMKKGGKAMHGKHPHHRADKKARGGRNEDAGAMATTAKLGKERPGFGASHTDGDDD